MFIVGDSHVSRIAAYYTASLEQESIRTGQIPTKKRSLGSPARGAEGIANTSPLIAIRATIRKTLLIHIS